MRNINCRNVRREIEDAALSGRLSETVDNHLSSCPACETFYREQGSLLELVSSLGTVAAPGDFDFRLRARLAVERHPPAGFLPRQFSLGASAAALVVLLLLIGGGFVVLNLKASFNNPVTARVPQTTKQPGKLGDAVRPAGVETTRAANANQGSTPIADDDAADYQPAKRRGPRQTELTSYRDSKRAGTREMANTQAAVLKANDQGPDAYPTTAFPIDASYQSMKVSVADGRGTSRTISLPSVSFGSQQALSQNASPVMASARGDW